MYIGNVTFGALPTALLTPSSAAAALNFQDHTLRTSHRDGHGEHPRRPLDRRPGRLPQAPHRDARSRRLLRTPRWRRVVAVHPRGADGDDALAERRRAHHRATVQG
eukprot:5180774-Prymnesium_polylepis.1